MREKIKKAGSQRTGFSYAFNQLLSINSEIR